MITLTPHMRLFIGIDPIDFRCGIDKLQIISENLSFESALTGTVFVFRNSLKTAVKILVYDGHGFWLIQRRLSTGKFRWWPKNKDEQQEVDSYVLIAILQGQDLPIRQEHWKRINPGGIKHQKENKI